jgi:hypothetical protein
MRMEVRRSAVESRPPMWLKPIMAAASSVITLLEVSLLWYSASRQEVTLKTLDLGLPDGRWRHF